MGNSSLPPFFLLTSVRKLNKEVWCRWGEGEGEDNIENGAPPPPFAWGFHMCALSLCCTLECSADPPVLHHQVLTLYSLFLFSFLFHSFLILSLPYAPLLHLLIFPLLPCLTSFPSSPTLLHPASSCSHGDLTLPFHLSHSPFPCCTTTTTSPPPFSFLLRSASCLL